MKLRTKLFLMLLITSLVPLLIFSAVSISSFVTNSTKTVNQLNEDKLAIVESEIDGMIDKHFNTLHTIAKQPQIRNFDIYNARKILAEAALVNPELVLALDNEEGEQLAISNGGNLSNVNGIDFFKKAINGEKAYVSNVLMDTDRNLIVVVATPIYDWKDRIVGVLEGTIQLERLSSFVGELSQNGSNVYVLSRKKSVLAHSNLEYVQNQENFSELDFVKDEFEGNENKTKRTKNYLGKEVIVSYSLNEATGWLIVVETPVSEAMGSAYELLNTSLVILVFSAIAVGLLGLYFSKRFTSPLVSLSSIIQTIAGGDLNDFDVEIKSKDEIGQLYHSLKSMTQNLRELVKNIQTVASSLATNSLQLSATTEESTQSLTQVVTTISEMAQGNGEQASMVQDQTESINRVDSIVSEATMKTEVAADKAKESLELAKVGQEAIQHQSQKIEENIKYTNAVGDSIQQLATMAVEIRNILGAIKSIAEQTNLLSLNASIEAARAGEAGKGFAVVADEIRKLAEESSNSTKKIEEIIKKISGRINETVNNMNQARESVTIMESSAEETKVSFAKILDSVAELAQLSHEVSVALDEINSETKEVTNQATSISAVVEQSSASMQEISASSEEQLASMEIIAQSACELENVAKDLLTQVTKFKVD